MLGALPSPTGPYLVGSRSHEFPDSSRPSHILGQEPGRALFVKLWYPATGSASDGCEAERLWEQLHAEPGIPGLARLLLRPAMKVTTNSLRGARYAADAGSARVLIYSHGLISFASENTSLMEHLASHGYTVVSVQHKEQLVELRALQGTQSEEEKQEQKVLEQRIKVADAAQRPALWNQYYRCASNTNQIVSARCADIEFVVANLPSVLAGVSGLDGHASAEVVGVLGLSLGGAVATEYAKGGGAGAECAVNIDGGIYGMQPDEPVDGRYLMLYSEPNRGINRASLAAADTAAVTTETFAATKHLNFHDIAMIYPKLRWLGAIGSARTKTVIDGRNRLITEFVSNLRAHTPGIGDEESLA